MADSAWSLARISGHLDLIPTVHESGYHKVIKDIGNPWGVYRKGTNRSCRSPANEYCRRL